MAFCRPARLRPARAGSQGEKRANVFERYTEKARRVIFFARYEASQYGSPYIETEHLLLGVCREGLTVREILKDADSNSAIRSEIERHTTRKNPKPSSVEIPLSANAKKVLHFAAEEADRLARRQITAAHMLLGILRAEDSLGAEMAKARGLHLDKIREKLAAIHELPAAAERNRKRAAPIVEAFLAGLNSQGAGSLMSFFARRALVIEVHGNRWTYDELAENFASVFAPYAKKNATYVVEETIIDSTDHLMAVVLWKNALVASMERTWMHRMTVVFVPREEWEIVSVEATSVEP